MKTKKGQAVMEFLMTYGWAILAAIISIAVLAYFGFFNPGRYGSTDYKCLSESLCENQGLEYSNYHEDPYIWCKEKIENVYKLTQFEVNWEDLKINFPECIKN